MSVWHYLYVSEKSIRYTTLGAGKLFNYNGLYMKNNRTIKLQVRVNDSELYVIDRLSRQKGISHAACLRQAVLDLAKANGIIPANAPKKPQ